MQPVQPARQVEQTTDQNGGQQQNADLAVNPVKNSENAGQARGGQQSGTQSGENTAAAASKEQIEQENEKIMKAISEMNKKMTSNTEAVFGIHEDTNRITIKLVDRTTKETIKELPPEKTLDMIAKAWELAGILVDERK
ncbi:MAG: flagellar protein FlaG [Butyrivibrio sp.]|nr:flagellar protein FlaG [Butyrivibrio sp.]